MYGNKIPFQKTYVRINLDRAYKHSYGLEFPIGNPYGGAAYGELLGDNWYNPVSWVKSAGDAITDFVHSIDDVVGDIGSGIDRYVIQPVYKNVVQPVGRAFEKVGQSIAKDPVQFISTVASIAAMVVPGMQWAVPLIAMANSAAHGGSFEDILKTGAISAATTFIAVEGGEYLTKSMEIAGKTGQYAVMGIDISAKTATTLANIATYTASGALKSAVSGQNVLNGALTGTATALIGSVSWSEIPGLTELSKSIDAIGKNINPSIANAISGAAGAGLTSMLTGKDMTAQAVIAGVGGLVGGLTSAVKIGESSLDAILKENLGDVGTSLMASTVTTVAASALLGGKASNQLTSLLTSSIAQTIGKSVAPGFAAMADGVRYMFSEAQTIQSNLESANNERSELVTNRNLVAKDINNTNARLENLYQAAEQAQKDYEDLFENGVAKDGVTNHVANRAIENLNSAIAAYEKQVSLTASDLQNWNNQLKEYDAQLPQLDKKIKTAQDEYIKKIDSLDNNSKALTQMLDKTSTELVKGMVASIAPEFNEEEYRRLNNIGYSTDAFSHYLSIGKDQGLPTNLQQAQPDIHMERIRIANEILKSQGYPSWQFVPKDLYNKMFEDVVNQYGDNLTDLKTATAQNFTKYNPTNTDTLDDYLPKSSWSVMQTSFKTKQEQAVQYWSIKPSADEFKMPTGMKFATQEDVLAGKATYSITKTGEVVWIKTDPSYVPPKQYNAATGNVEPKPVQTTKVEDLDPYTMVETFASMDKAVVANFPDQAKQLAVKAAKNAMEYAGKTGNYYIISGTSVAIRAGGELLKSVGDLTTFLNISPQSTWSSDLAKSLSDVAMASTPEEYKDKLNIMNKRWEDAKGAGGIADAIIQNASEFPIEFAMEYIGKEVIQEVPWWIAGAGAAKFTKDLAGALGATETVAKYAGKLAGISTDRALNIAEAAGGEAGDAFNDAMATINKVHPEWTKTQKEEYAFGVAQDVGATAATMALLTAGVGLDKLPNVLFGGRVASEASQKTLAALATKIKDGAVVIGSQGLGESIEEAATAARKEMLLYQMDNTRDVSKNIAFSAAMGAIGGSGTTASIMGLQSMYSAAVSSAVFSNKAFEEQVTKFKNGDYTIGEFGVVLNQWIPPKEAFAVEGATPSATDYAYNYFKDYLVSNVYSSNPELYSKYSSNPAKLASDLKILGVTDTDTINSVTNNAIIHNSSVDEKIKLFAETIPKNLSTSMIPSAIEARNALAKAGLEQITDADVDNYTAAVTQAISKPNSNSYIENPNNYYTVKKLYDAVQTAKYTGKSAYFILNESPMRTYEAAKANLANTSKFGGDPVFAYLNTYSTNGERGYNAYLAAQKRMAEGYEPFLAFYYQPRDYYDRYKDTAFAGVSQKDFSLWYYATISDRNKYFTPDEIKTAITGDLTTFRNIWLASQDTPLTPGQIAAIEKGMSSQENFADFFFDTRTNGGRRDKNFGLDPEQLRQLQSLNADQFSNWFYENYKASNPNLKSPEEVINLAKENAGTKYATAYAKDLMIDTAEAKQMLIAAGYKSPPDSVANLFAKRMTATEANAAINTWVEEHQLTAEDVRKEFAALGFTPSESQVSQYVKTVNPNLDKASIIKAIGSYVDANQVTLKEATEYFKALNFTPTEEQLRQFITQGSEAGIKKSIASFVAQQTVTADTVKKMFTDLSYTPSKAEINSFLAQAKQVGEIAAKTGVAAYVDQNYVTAAEAAAAAASEGYALTEGELAQYVGQKAQAVALAQIKLMADPKAVTAEEVRAAMSASGFTPTDEQVARFIGVKNEAQTLKEIRAYVDPFVISDSEVRAMYESLGYTPTDKEVSDYVGQRAENEVRAAIAKHVDENYVTIDEVKAAAAAEGYNISDKDAEAYIGQYNQALKLKDVTTFADANYVLKQEAQDFFAKNGYVPTAEELDKFVGQQREEGVIQSIKDYINPRQVTLEEVKEAAAKEGYNISDEEAEKYVGQWDAARKLAEVTEYADVNSIVDSEAAKYFSDAGYTPTADELKQFIGQKKESDVADAIAKYADPRVTTVEEVKAAAAKEGYTLSDEEAAKYIGQLSQATQEEAVREYSDPFAVTAEEARQYFQSEGYTPTADDIAKYVGQGNEAEIAQVIANYADSMFMSEEEARKYMNDLGYTAPTNEEVLQFVNQAEEAGVKSALENYVNNHQVTRQEAINFFASFGYTPSDQEVANYIKQGAGISQDDVAKALGEYVDPRLVDASEVQEAFKALGLNAPVSGSDLARLSGQYDESLLADKAKEALPVASANAIYALMAGDQVVNQQVKDAILAKIEEYKQLGQDQATAQASATAAIAAQLGTTKSDLLTALGATENNFMVKLQNVEANLSDKITQYRNEGLTQAEATKKALEEMATNLGTTKTDLLAQIGATEANLQTKLTDAAKLLQDQITANQNAGMDAIAATNKAVQDVAAQLGITADNLLAQMGTNQQQLMTQLGQTQTQLQTDISKAKQDIQNQMSAYEQAGIDRDTALDLAIAGVSQDLGTTKADLLAKLGTTETNLKAEMQTQSAQLTGQIQNIQQLVGRPTQQATAADATTIQGIIAGTTPVNLAYDTNNDGKVDQTDLTNVQNQLAFQQNQNLQQQIDTETGLPVWIDKTTGQPVSGPAALGGQWAPTGIYAALQQQEARQAATAKAAAAQAKQAQQKNQFGQLVNMLFSAPDAAGQSVTVKTPDPSRINYIYDWSSIFATPSQASMMPSPYGAMNTVAPQQQRQASNQPLFQFASGFAEGGIVGGDMEVGGSSNVDDLLNILKGNG